MSINKSEWIAKVKEEIHKTRNEITLLEKKKINSPNIFTPIENMKLNSLYEVLNELKNKFKNKLKE